jgi:hypothetical protein
MAAAVLPKLIALNEYALSGPAEAFHQATNALAARVKAEGELGVLAYLFFMDPAAGSARAVVHYKDSAAWIGHHDRSFNWPEMKALHAAARLARVTLLGEVTEAMQDWLRRAGLSVPLTLLPDGPAGFVRVP